MARCFAYACVLFTSAGILTTAVSGSVCPILTVLFVLGLGSLVAAQFEKAEKHDPG